jgi:hypothetical protein
LRLANCKQAKEVEPYLARFEDDWVTGQILRQYINGRRKYETAKANGMENGGDKRQRMSVASVTDQRINRHRHSVGSEKGGGDNGSDNEMDGSSGFDKTGSNYDDEWTGIDHGSFAWSDDEDMEVNGNENSG